MEDYVNKKQESTIHSFDKSQQFLSGKFLFIIVGVLVLAVGTGYLLTVNARGTLSVGSSSNSESSSSTIPKGTIEGSDDTKTFRDVAEGVLQKGGIEGEGQYHLKRPGGESQNVYMTSSVVDLSKYIGLKVKVWGQTNAAQKAGWLMDVGRIEVL